MIKVDIVNEVSKIADITKVKAEVAVDAVFDAMRTSMQRGERIELRGLRRLPGEAPQARHRPQPSHRQGSAHPAGPHDPLQARQRPPEHRLTLDPDSARLAAEAQVPGSCLAARSVVRPDGRDDHLDRRRPLRRLSRRFPRRRRRRLSSARCCSAVSGTAAPILAILGCHELGHYFACRYYDVDASLPFFLPVPPPFLTGTLGAFIRIREPIPEQARCCSTSASPDRSPASSSRCPALFIGLALSHVARVPPAFVG